MLIRDKIEEYNLYFVEQDLPNVTFYEIYHNSIKIFQVKNKFEVALNEWCSVVSQVVDKQKVLG